MNDSAETNEHIPKPFLHDPDFRVFERLNGLEGLFLDVGANVGQSALSFFSVNNSFKVLSLEPNLQLKSYLTAIHERFPGRFDYISVGASNLARRASLLVPTAANATATVYSTLLPGELKKEYVKQNIRSELLAQGGNAKYHLERIEVELIPIDVLNLRPSVIKIDVEGSERWVLLGAEATIMASHPILLIEVNTDSVRIFSMLESIGYKAYYYSSAEDRIFRWPKRLSGSIPLNAFWIHPSLPLPMADRLRPLFPRDAFVPSRESALATLARIVGLTGFQRYKLAAKFGF